MTARPLCARLTAVGVVCLCVSQLAAVASADEKNLPDWLQLDAEYRVRQRYINPFELSGTEFTEAAWADQRLRLDLGLVREGVGRLVLQVDALDGALMGDNGTFGSDPEPSSGLSLASKWPNNASWEVGLLPGGDPLDPDGYGPVLRSIEPLAIHQIYGEVNLPIGLLRVGRQPYNEGAGISAHQGTRINRWGVSSYSHTADRVLFATKLDEAFHAMAGSREPDLSRDNGIFFIAAFDWGTQDDIYRSEDDLHQVLGSIQWKVADAHLYGIHWRDILVSTALVHRFSKAFGTRVFGIPFRVTGQAGPVKADLQLSMLRGESEEISAGTALLTGDEPTMQEVYATGAHARIDVELGPVELTAEFDYATGDDDPRGDNPMTTFSFARDFNVGLLLFEHILAFESARSAMVGIENLAQVEASSFPLTEIRTDGRFTNAIAFFPQFKLTLVDQPRHKLHWRGGVLMAWAERGVVDPIMSVLRIDGDSIVDDLVNYHGGKPGSYYGTELDTQIEWTFADLFVWTLEGAVLFPGDGLQDEHGHAVTAFFAESRFTFLF